MIKWNLIEKVEPEKGRHIFYIGDQDKQFFEDLRHVRSDYVFSGEYLGHVLSGQI